MGMFFSQFDMDTELEVVREESYEEGREEGFFQSAINLLKLGFSVEDAQRVTGLSIEKINELKAAF